MNKSRSRRRTSQGATLSIISPFGLARDLWPAPAPRGVRGPAAPKSSSLHSQRRHGLRRDTAIICRLL